MHKGMCNSPPACYLDATRHQVNINQVLNVQKTQRISPLTSCLDFKTLAIPSETAEQLPKKMRV